MCWADCFFVLLWLRIYGPFYLLECWITFTFPKNALGWNAPELKKTGFIFLSLKVWVNLRCLVCMMQVETSKFTGCVAQLQRGQTTSHNTGNAAKCHSGWGLEIKRQTGWTKVMKLVQKQTNVDVKRALFVMEPLCSSCRLVRDWECVVSWCVCPEGCVSACPAEREAVMFLYGETRRSAL